MSEPGPLGWVGRLFRWSDADSVDRGQGGPLPPPRAKVADPSEHELYQGLADGWLHGTVGAALSSFFSEPRTRKELYVLFEKMDMTDVAGAVLDQYAEDATMPDPETGFRIWVESANAAIVEASHALRDRTRLEEEIPGITRDVAKFGDDFERLVYRSGPTGGIMRLLPVPPLMITRREDKEARLEGYLQTGKRFRNDNSEVSYPWDFVHFRRRGRDRRYPYGTSILHNGIRPWKQCLAAGTLVWTDRGPVPVEQTVHGDAVYCHDPDTGETRKTRVVAAGKTGDKELYRVRTQHREIVVTADHPMLVRRRDGAHVYREAKDLRYPAMLHGAMQERCADSDYLVLPRVGGATQTVSLSSYKDRLSVRLASPFSGDTAGFKDAVRELGLSASYKNAHSFLKYGKALRYEDYEKLLRRYPLEDAVLYVTGSKTPCPVSAATLSFQVDEDFARFFGFMLGDGWLLHAGAGAGFALSVYEERNQFYVDLATRLFGHAPLLTPPKPGKGGVAQVQAQHAGLMLEAAGFVTGFANKVMPAWAYAAPLNIKRAIVHGICDADGGESSGGSRLGLSNRPLIEAVQMLAQQAGFRVSRAVGGNGYVGKEGPHRAIPAMTVPVQRAESYRIFSSPPETEAAVDYERVTSVELIGFGPVYDLTVDDPVHNFVANGVVVHNCIIFEDWMLGYTVNRKPDRNIVFLDNGSASEVESVDVTRQFQQKLKRHLIIDPAGLTRRGNISYDHNPLTPMEDFVLPIRGKDNATRIERLSGSGSALDITPIQFVLDKFYAAVRAPKAFFGIDYNSGMPMNMKASLTNQDIRYARNVRHLQTCVKAGLRYLFELNLMLIMSPGDMQKGVVEPGLVSQLDWRREGGEFTVRMGPISYLEEMERLEVEQLRQQVALAMLEVGANNPAIDIVRWTNYVLREIVRVPEDELEQLLNPDVDSHMANLIRFNLDPATFNKPGTISPPVRESDVTRREKQKLGEAINGSPTLRKEIARAARLFREADSPVISDFLPDRNNELFKSGYLKDTITEADLVEALSEVQGK